MLELQTIACVFAAAAYFAQIPMPILSLSIGANMTKCGSWFGCIVPAFGSLFPFIFYLAPLE